MKPCEICGHPNKLNPQKAKDGRTVCLRCLLDRTEEGKAAKAHVEREARRRKQQRGLNAMLCEILETAAGMNLSWFQGEKDGQTPMDTWVLALRDRCNAYLKARKS